MGHPDFRVGSRIFATLGPQEQWGMVTLTPEQQLELIHDHPGVFEAIKGGWGRKGATKVLLRPATKSVLLPALVAAWRGKAPKELWKRIG
jgi:hypothetical protein